MVQMKRVYEPAEKSDGYRILVDRLWPRGIKKSDLRFEEWAKELAPSDALRKSFGHNISHWTAFQTKYRKELQSKTAASKIKELVQRARRGTVTLLYSAKDEEHNNAIVLQKLLNRKLAK